MNHSRDEIDLYGPQSRSMCGYCKCYSGTETSFGFGCSSMMPGNYLELMNRGWRRCGTYYYINYNDKICCPMYTIRCKTVDLLLTKSQRKTLKRFKNFLQNGSKKSTESVVELHGRGDEMKVKKSPKIVGANNVSVASSLKDKSQKSRFKRHQLKIAKLKTRAEKEGVGFEKLLLDYQDRRKKRLAKNKPKLLSDLLDFSKLKSPCHTLEVKTVRCNPVSSKLNSTINKEHKVYQNYQIDIHGDKPYEANIDQFKRFLVKGGLRSDNKTDEINFDSKNQEFPQGQYHQQYWLDYKTLIAVGVIDILPNCVSSVYLFYDPAYSFLNLGVFSALYEINFVNNLSRAYQKSDFNYYYMGFYIHNCRKMRYKAQYIGSELLCPVTLRWVPVEKCQKALDKAKFARFSDEECESEKRNFDNMSEDDVMSMVKVKVKGKMTSLSRGIRNRYILEFAKLVGSNVLSNIVLKF